MPRVGVHRVDVGEKPATHLEKYRLLYWTQESAQGGGSNDLVGIGRHLDGGRNADGKRNGVIVNLPPTPNDPDRIQVRILRCRTSGVASARFAVLTACQSDRSSFTIESIVYHHSPLHWLTSLGDQLDGLHSHHRPQHSRQRS